MTPDERYATKMAKYRSATSTLFDWWRCVKCWIWQRQLQSSAKHFGCQDISDKKLLKHSQLLRKYNGLNLSNILGKQNQKMQYACCCWDLGSGNGGQRKTAKVTLTASWWGETVFLLPCLLRRPATSSSTWDRPSTWWVPVVASNTYRLVVMEPQLREKDFPSLPVSQMFRNKTQKKRMIGIQKRLVFGLKFKIFA